MPDEFDPYLAWLGIPATSRPASHYQLLGLAEFETDPTRIAAAADARMAEVRSHQTGPRGRFTQQLLNELSAARRCLIDQRAKSAYDVELLRQRANAYVPLPTAVMYVPIEVPPLAAPPSIPPPRSTQTAHNLTTGAEANDAMDLDASASTAGKAWWLWGCFFLAIICGTVAAAYVLRERLAAKPVAKITAPAAPTPPPPEEQELVIVQEGNGDLSFPASTAELSEGLARTEMGGESFIIDWQPETTVARWRFRTIRPAVFQVRMVYEISSGAAGQWQLRIADEVKSREIQTPADEGGKVTDEFFWRVSRSGVQTLELSTPSLSDSAVLRLKSVRFIYQPGGPGQ